MFLRPASTFKRVAAIVIGISWIGIGGTWTYFNATAPTNANSPDDPGPKLGIFILLGGTGLIASGLRGTRSSHIEAETPDLHEGFTEHRWRD